MQRCNQKWLLRHSHSTRDLTFNTPKKVELAWLTVPSALTEPRRDCQEGMLWPQTCFCASHEALYFSYEGQLWQPSLAVTGTTFMSPQSQLSGLNHWRWGRRTCGQPLCIRLPVRAPAFRLAWQVLHLLRPSLFLFLSVWLWPGCLFPTSHLIFMELLVSHRTLYQHEHPFPYPILVFI